MLASGVDGCRLAGDNGFQETGHRLPPTTQPRSVQSGSVGVNNGENEGKVEIFLEREEVSGEWRDILVVKRGTTTGEVEGKRKKKEEASSNRNVARLRIKVIASSYSSLAANVCCFVFPIQKHLKFVQILPQQCRVKSGLCSVGDIKH